MDTGNATDTTGKSVAAAFYTLMFGHTMKNYGIVAIILAGLFVVLMLRCSKGIGAELGHDTVIFTRQLGDCGQSIVVTRGPDLDKAQFCFCKGEQLNQVRRLYEVRVEVHTPNANPIVLASYIRREQAFDFDRDVLVLDALVEGGEITLCLAEGADLAVWHIGVLSCADSLLPGPPAGIWSRRTAPYRIDDHLVTAKLSRTLGDLTTEGKLLLEISEQGNPQSYSFQAGNGENEPTFKLLRRRTKGDASR